MFGASKYHCANLAQKVFEVARVNVDLSEVPQRLFRKGRSPCGRVFHELVYEVHISLQASLVFSLVVGGRTYGDLTAEYD